MKKYIALLRGINVGGHKKFPKVDQLQMLDALGFQDFQVYLHTGNWVFVASKTTSEISEMITHAIQKKYGWEVPVLVFPSAEIEHILNACPFSEEKKVKSYFTLLSNKPTQEQSTLLETIAYPNEEFVLQDRCIYLFPEKDAAKATLSNNFFEKKLHITATTRNYNTMLKLVALSC